MPRLALLLAALLVLPVAAQPGTAVDGTWATTYGAMTLHSEGPSVSGTYAHDGGSRLEGTLRDGVLEGTWYEPRSARQCPDVRGGTAYWGRLRFAFSEAGRFEGRWNHCDGELTRSWVGERTSGPPASDAAVALSVPDCVSFDGQPLAALGRFLTVEGTGDVPPLALLAARVEDDHVVERFTSGPLRPGDRFLPRDPDLPGWPLGAVDHLVPGEPFVINGVFAVDYAPGAVEAARRAAGRPGADALLLLLVPTEAAWERAEGMRSTPLIVLFEERR
ncbi:hypothetical protein [Rubrivirga marina]|uniref:Uncharacterized protein n=1 Tax=Rubrivirga marina TaxID=1196024 RepID=A0A271IXV4_9BACT|nr:hypothetical protein [Rubrivirga marina]PAP75634.1 hypothetical protein BSZ37_03880 [Rubrivirga marina]